MANGGQSGQATTLAVSGVQKPATNAHSEQSKRDLTSWWKTFKRGNTKPSDDKVSPDGIFGVPLHQSIRYANVAISLFNDEGQSYIYGYVPIVVAKCGVFLKEKATDVEGIFRLSGSEKRIKELKIAFDSPDRYGKGLDWTGYTVHDAANILRRYFNQLPEPIIPLEFYERFRQPLRNHQAQAVGVMDAQGPELGLFDAEQAIRAYQGLITELPPLNRQLLLYILDLLAVFASKSDLNKMTTPNLAAIFQPGLLSHPQHDMAPQEYRLSQDVLIFLIENQDSFLIGMHGTAADEKTVKEVQSGAPSPNPGTPTTASRSRNVFGRSASNASAGADSVRQWGNIRRNVSVSSRTSKKSIGGPSPASPAIGSPNTLGSGIYRSNTVPSKRSAGASPRFFREKSLDPQTPSPGSLPLPINNTASSHSSQQTTPIAEVPTASLAPPDVTSASSSETATPMGPPQSDTSSAILIPKDHQTPQRDSLSGLAPPSSIKRDVSSERAYSNTPSKDSRSAFLDIFKQSPGSDVDRKDGRRPNKLQKKRLPGSSLSSAASSAQSLQSGGEGMEEILATSPVAPNFFQDLRDVPGEAPQQRSAYATAQTTPRETTPQRMPTDDTLRPTISPPQSYHSHASATDTTDADDMDETVQSGERQKQKRRWRFSQSTKQRDSAQVTPTAQSIANMGTLQREEQSRSTLASNGPSRPVPAATQELSPPRARSGASPSEQVTSDSEDKKKGPIGWIRGKLAERKEREAEKRAQTPPRNRDRSDSRHSLNVGREAMPVRGKSVEVPRQQSTTLAEVVEQAKAVEEGRGQEGVGVVPHQQ